MVLSATVQSNRTFKAMGDEKQTGGTGGKPSQGSHVNRRKKLLFMLRLNQHLALLKKSWKVLLSTVGIQSGVP